MYLQAFGLTEPPFSITPDPRFVYLSPQHEDALAHLTYGIEQGGGGGFVQLTGEVGTGKTTLCRLLLQQVPKHVRIALVLNPMLTPEELLAAICKELQIDTDHYATHRERIDALNQYLLDAYAANETVVVIIDEAQNLSFEALEQLRLLTNLETNTQKLLQIVLLGQPELRDKLQAPHMRQLSQRISARFHLGELPPHLVGDYLAHRLRVAGYKGELPFSRAALRYLASATGGIPRLINTAAERSFLAAYAGHKTLIDKAIVKRACSEALPPRMTNQDGLARWLAPVAWVLVAVIGLAGLSWGYHQWQQPQHASPTRTPSVATVEVAGGDWSQAVAEVLGQWHVQIAGPVASCRDAVVAGMRCWPASGNLAKIARIGRPVVLQLSGQASPTYLAVTDVDNGYVYSKGQRYDRDTVTAQWLGQYYDWYNPAWESSTAIAPGEEFAPLRGFKRLARLAEPPFSGQIHARYDAALQEWVRAFQQAHGLRADGLIGPETLYFLSLYDQRGPRFSTEGGAVEDENKDS